MSENKSVIKIGDVNPFSIVDFPDRIAAVVFMQGCPWRCPFCYNRELQPLDISDEPLWTFEKFLLFIEKRKHALDAVVFSGGEPLMQKGLSKAVKEVKNLGFTVGLHTGGYDPKALENVLEYVDWVGFDIKGPKEKYKSLTGGFGVFDEVLKSLDKLIKSGVDFECRTTCDPRALTVEDLFETGQFLKKAGVKEYYLQKYRPVESDKTTSDMQCEALISDKDLTAFLKASFEKFDVRR